MRLIPVLLRPAILPLELTRLATLPRSGRPPLTWKDQGEALVTRYAGPLEPGKHIPRDGGLFEVRDEGACLRGPQVNLVAAGTFGAPVQEWALRCRITCCARAPAGAGSRSAAGTRPPAPGAPTRAGPAGTRSAPSRATGSASRERVG